MSNFFTVVNDIKSTKTIGKTPVYFGHGFKYHVKSKGAAFDNTRTKILLVQSGFPRYESNCKGMRIVFHHTQ